MRKIISAKHIRFKQASEMRKRRRWNEYVNKRNVIRYNLPKPYREKRKRRQPLNFGWEMTTVPSNFTFNHLESVLGYINKTYERSKKGGVSKIWMDMRGISNIDIYTICLLLAQINKLGSHGVNCYGNYPDDPMKRRFVMESGFMKIIKSNVKISNDVSYENQMYMVGKDEVESDRINKSVKRCMKQLLGAEDYYPPVYENMIEICANSVEHANTKSVDKNWLVSISRESQDKMRFILTDTGEGLLKTLSKKRKEMFNDVLKARSDYKVLKGVFLREYQSRTGEINRHKGLPEVYESYKDGFISNLKVLTNGVLYDFDSDQNVKLTNEFMGVMITWTLSKENVNIWKKSLSEC
jgi:hypothetical protein